MAHHAVKVHKSTMLIHGGLCPVPSPLLYRFHFATQDLEVIEAANSGPILYSHTIDVVDGVVYAFGGLTYSQGQYDAMNNQLFCFDLATGVWRTVSFLLKGVESEVAEFQRAPLMMHIVRQTRQIWRVGRGGKVYIAALPTAEGASESLLFFLHCSPGKFPESRSFSVTAAVGRTLWLLFGEEVPAEGGLSDPLGMSRVLSEDYITARRSFSDLHIFAIDTSSFTSSLHGLLASSRSRPLNASAAPGDKEKPHATATTASRPQASEVATSPMRYRELREGGKVAALTRLLKEKHDFDRVKDILLRQDIMAHNEITDYGHLLSATVEKYLHSCEAPKKRVGRKRRELQQAKATSQSLRRTQTSGDGGLAPSPVHRELRQHRTRSRDAKKRGDKGAKTSRAWQERRREAAGAIQMWVRRRWMFLASRVECDKRRAARREEDAEAERRVKEQEQVFACGMLQCAARSLKSRQERRLREKASAQRLQEDELAVDAQIEAMRQDAARKIQVAQQTRVRRLRAEATRREEAERRAKAALEQEKEVAACKIQCQMRSRMARQTVGQKREVLRARQTARENAAATRIQAAQRGRLGRVQADRLREEQRAAAAERERETKAATRIQAVQRGRTARAEATQRAEQRQLEREDRERRQSAAATRIQSVQRGRAARRRAGEAKATRASASRRRSSAIGILVAESPGDAQFLKFFAQVQEEDAATAEAATEVAAACDGTDDLEAAAPTVTVETRNTGDVPADNKAPPDNLDSSEAAQKAALRIQCQIRRRRARRDAQARQAERELEMARDAEEEDAKYQAYAATLIQQSYKIKRPKTEKVVDDGPAVGDAALLSSGVEDEEDASRAVCERKERTERLALGVGETGALRGVASAKVERGEAGVAAEAAPTVAVDAASEGATEEEERAALKIQALHRGNRGRRDAEKQRSVGLTLSSAATPNDRTMPGSSTVLLELSPDDSEVPDMELMGP
eukprot:TRINITY_DN1020_c0_g1_i2.p1 TRINITY_DN1020_c0_g1~~TRINITY_DN1020_c0_g1_i2.p1  ORF type:complete len:1003 (+),score=218.03 TRINITY_DN1020_c0_g1_i2:84-3011(+)